MITRLRSYLAGSGLGPTLVKAVSGSAGPSIAGMGFGFLVGVQLARGLGAEGYGIYGVGMSIIALLTVPTRFGLPQLLTREVVVAKVKRDWGRMKGILRWSSRVLQAGNIPDRAADISELIANVRYRPVADMGDVGREFCAVVFGVLQDPLMNQQPPVIHSFAGLQIPQVSTGMNLWQLAAALPAAMTRSDCFIEFGSGSNSRYLAA